MSRFSKLLPMPLMSVALFAIWLGLVRSTSVGQVLLGILLAVVAPILAAPLRPTMRVRSPRAVVRFIARVAADVVLFNFEVARGVIGWRWRPPQSKFVVVPLELRDPVGLTVLAMVTTVVPGTVWSELALDRSKLLLHAWDVDEEAAFVARFKARYELPLREIFE
jgi:multicomponent K+:H+ antiporter subunit E